MTMNRFAIFAATVLSAALGSDATAVGPTPDATHRDTYQNPILDDGSMADPHYCCSTASTTCIPPRILTATTCSSRTISCIGRTREQRRGGAWAPDVFHPHGSGGKFYLYYTDNLPDSRSLLDKQIGVAVSDSPLGPFTDEQVLVRDAIDAHLYENNDGKLFLYYVHLPGGFRIMVQPMADPLTPQGEPIEAVRPTEPWEKVSGHVTEGPCLIKRGDTYYI